LDQLGKALKIKNYPDWYKVTIRQLKELDAKPFLELYYKGIFYLRCYGEYRHRCMWQIFLVTVTRRWHDQQKYLSLCILLFA
jgi:hypothetical protein